MSKEGKGIYAKFMSREYKEAWNKLTWKHTSTLMFKNLDDEGNENETSNKL